ncbi:MAG TPA: tetratricopeptide repeat protein [Flavobacteriales bacterium]|nr:tetratricopeptide repeat protein [Flavobacteriales bacterium]
MKRSGYTIFLVSVLCLNTLSLFCQDSRADSLEQALRSAKHDTSRIHTLNALFLHYEYSDTQKAKTYIDQSLAICQTIQNDRELARAYALRGYLYEDLGHYDEALKNLFKALGLRKKTNDLSGEAKISNTIGNIYSRLGKHVLAMQYYNRSLETRIKLNNKDEIADAYYNIALVYETQGNYPKALKNAYTCLKLLEEIKDSSDIASCYTFIGLIHDDQEYFSESLKYHEAALKIALRLNNKKNMAEAYSNLANTYSAMKKNSESLKRHIRALRLYEEIKDKKGIAVAYNNIALIYSANGDNEGALKHHFASLKIKEEINAPNGIAVSCINIGDVYITKGDYAKAREYLLRAKKLSETGGWREYLKYTYQSLTRLDSLRGDFRNAFANRRMYYLYRDSLDNEEVRKRTTEEKLTYDFKKKEAVSQAKHNHDLKHHKQLADEKNRKQNIIISFIGGALILVILIVVFIFRGYRTKQKINTLLNEKNILIEKQKKEVEDKNKKIGESIKYASRIQKAVLPPEEKFNAALPDSFVFFRPKNLVSGNFYWYAELHGKLVVVVAESTASGVPGAFMSMVGNTMLNEIVNEKKITDPASILSRVNKGLKDLLQSKTTGQEDHVDISVLTIDKNKQELVYAGANQVALLLTGNEISEIKGNAVSLGGTGAQAGDAFSVTSKKIQKGTIMYLFTQGFARQFNIQEGNGHARELFASIGSGDLKTGKDILSGMMEQMSEKNPQAEDVLLLTLRF